MSLAACASDAPSDGYAGDTVVGDVDTGTETPAGQQLVGEFTVDVDADGKATVSMVDRRLATSVTVGAGANRVALTSLSQTTCAPSTRCWNMRLTSGFAAHDLRGVTVTLTKLTGGGATSLNSDTMPSHLVGTTALATFGVWLYGDLAAGSPGGSLDREWRFGWTGGSISLAGKVFADVVPAGANAEAACDDGVDNEGDGRVDCLDGDCATDPACPAETCADLKSRDEDSNGLSNCADPACSGHPACAPPPGGDLFAGGGRSGAGSIFKIDADTAAATLVGSIGNGYGVTGMAFHPESGTLYASTVGEGRDWISIDVATGAGTTIGGLGGQPIPDIDFLPDGTAIGWTESSDQPIYINIATGGTSVLGDSVGSRGSGLAADGSGTIWSSPFDCNGLYTHNRDTGVATFVVPLSGHCTNGRINAMTYHRGELYGVYSSWDGSGTQLVRINTATGAVTAVGELPGQTDALASQNPWGE